MSAAGADTYERRMVTLALRGLQGRRRLYGRLAGLLFFGSGAVTIATLPLPAAPGLNRPALVLVAGIAGAAGVFAWLAPWDRWPRPSSLALVPIALGLIAAGNSFGGSDPRAYGIFFIVVFVWIGISHPPWTSLLMAPLAAVAYVAPIIALSDTSGSSLSSAAVTIPVCILVGESLAWGTNQLAKTEDALRTERETAARLRAVDELRTTFMRAASHELRTPITISRGHLEVLGSDPNRDEVSEALAIVIDELGRMGRIVGDITTLVSMEDPEFLRIQSVNLEPFVSELVAKAGPLLGDRLHLGPISQEAALASVDADPQRLTQALLNLLHNAAIHTDGPVDFGLVRADGAWRFEVADRGSGLPSGGVRSLFQPFVRGNSPAPGSGLGLAIARGIAEAHGGSAGAHNRLGGGATFWIALPRDRAGTATE
jgi:signal transduction histidine kinase